MQKITSAKLFFASLTTAFLLCLSPFNVLAQVAPPSFPSCLNPQGVVISSFTDGIHGIPGDSQSYQGSDIVYSVTPTTVTQCFCSPTGQGIQSDWWKVSDLTTEEIQSFQSQGWVFVPDGSVWGLDPAAYLVQNISFSCTSGGGGGGGGGGSSSSSSSSGGGGGSVSSASTGPVGEVLGLASTGNLVVIVSWLTLGSLLTIVGFALRKFHRP